MSISLDEVRHIAALARLGMSEERARVAAVELSSILEHMQVLSKAAGADSSSNTDRSMPLRPDVGPPIPLARPPIDFAPSMRDGFFLVPRLETHEDSQEGA